VEPPQLVRTGIDFIQADVRNPALNELLKAEAVHTVCHLKFFPANRPSAAASDLNVLGTAHLLNACAAASVSRVIIKSSTTLYGAHPDNPSFLHESAALRASRRYGYIKDLLEIEALCNVFRRQAPEIALTVLRFAAIVGPTADTPMTRLLRETWSPILLGFDPMVQIIHEADVVEALAHVAHNGVPGTYNVAADPAMPLSQIIGLAGKPPVPVFHPLVDLGVEAFRVSGLGFDRFAPIDPVYLRYSWVADLTGMRRKLGYLPRYTAQETLKQFATRGHFESPSEFFAAQEDRLREAIERRRSFRDHSVTAEKGNKNG
jgi:UDP-glucose 4-epimerase